jgi:co-chaperonin GroES (HSP10)
MSLGIPTVKRGYRSNQVSKIQALGENVLVRDMNFEQRVTAGGIILMGDDGKDSGIRPRWCRIYAVGPLQQDPELTVGRYILVSHGRWTRGIDVEVDGEKFTIRKVDLKEILLVSDEPVQDDTMSDKVVK